MNPGPDLPCWCWNWISPWLDWKENQTHRNDSEKQDANFIPTIPLLTSV